jgi:hypothetical protein
MLPKFQMVERTKKRTNFTEGDHVEPIKPKVNKLVQHLKEQVDDQIDYLEMEQRRGIKDLD